MDNKGFTLVELLATVVILGLVMGIGAYGISNTINNSKKRSEAIFVGKLDDIIEEYIQHLNLKEISLEEVAGGTEFEFEKCSLANCYDEVSDSYISGSYYIGKAKQLVSIKISDLKNSGLFDKEALINPANKLDCFDGIDPEIKIFRDDDYVYYYYLDLGDGNNTCEVSSENSIINTLPDNLFDKLVDNNIINGGV